MFSNNVVQGNVFCWSHWSIDRPQKRESMGLKLACSFSWAKILIGYWNPTPRAVFSSVSQYGNATANLGVVPARDEFGVMPASFLNCSSSRILHFGGLRLQLLTRCLFFRRDEKYDLSNIPTIRSRPSRVFCRSTIT